MQEEVCKIQYVCGWVYARPRGGLHRHVERWRAAVGYQHSGCSFCVQNAARGSAETPATSPCTAPNARLFVGADLVPSVVALVLAGSPAQQGYGHAHAAPVAVKHSHGGAACDGHGHGHGHGQPPEAILESNKQKGKNSMAMLGLIVHAAIDGVALGASTFAGNSTMASTSI